MGTARIVLAVAVLTGWLHPAAAADPAPTLANVAPVVVKTEPQAGSEGVAAGAAEIRVTFSKKMRDGDWSWSMVSKESFPAMTGNPHFLPDGKTCALPVALESGRTYAIWINNPPAQNFQDEQGRKALPYLIVFSTK